MTKTITLENKIKECGYKKCYIAAQLGISSYSLARKINNKSPFTADEVASLAKVLRLTSAETIDIFLQ